MIDRLNKPRIARSVFFGAVFLLSLIALPVAAQDDGLADPALLEEVAVPPLRGRVTDLTGTLTENERRELDAVLGRLEVDKGAQVVVLIVPTTGPEAIEQYSIRVAEEWQIGRGKVDDGVILLVAKEDRRLRIEVGYGLEGAIPDALASRIIREHIVPHFRDGEFYTGIRSGVDVIAAAIMDEPLPEPAQTSSGGDGGTSDAADKFSSIVFIGAFLIGAFFRAIPFPWRFFFSGGLGVVTFVIGVILSVGLASALFYGVLMFIITVIGLSGGRIGGGGFSSGGGGGFSGGFSGGGGSFGGGGASGSW